MAMALVAMVLYVVVGRLYTQFFSALEKEYLLTGQVNSSLMDILGFVALGGNIRPFFIGDTFIVIIVVAIMAHVGLAGLFFEKQPYTATARIIGAAAAGATTAMVFAWSLSSIWGAVLNSFFILLYLLALTPQIAREARVKLAYLNVNFGLQLVLVTGGMYLIKL